MSLKRLFVSSNASRNVHRWALKWYERQSCKQLSFRRKSNAGRSRTTGQVIVHTKSALLTKVKLLKINYFFRALEPGVVSTFKLVPFSNKLLAFVVFASGSYAYLPSAEKATVFSLFTFRSGKRSLSHFEHNSHYSNIYLIGTSKKISNIEIRPNSGSQYVRSAGCFAKIIKFDYLHHAALTQLPSGVKKFFSFYSSLILGPCALKLKRTMKCTKSGVWRTYGLKPKVRGVARNPVDHPHGGRTKSIKYPRTPWGKTTKFK